MQARTLPANLLLGALVVIILATVLFPYAIMLTTGLRPLSEIQAQEPAWWPRTLAWENLVAVWTDFPMARFLGNSTLVALGTSLLMLSCAVPAAFVLARKSFRGSGLFLKTILLTQMLSPAVMLIPLFRIYRGLNLINSRVGLVVVDAAFILPFCIWLLYGFFKSVPREVEEAAAIDGCSNPQVMLRIMCPLSLPGLAATFIYAFLFAWNEFIFALTFITHSAKKPLTVGIFEFVGMWQTSWHHLMLAAVIGTIPVFVLFLLAERHIRSGFTAGMGK